MKKSKKLLAFLMGATMLAASMFGGCDGGELYPEASTDGAPDYSQTEVEFNKWSMGMVYDTWIMFNGERIYFEDGFFQTKEKTEQLKNAGYNTVFVDWSFSGVGFKAGYEGSNFEKVVRDCEELGLNTLWFGSEFHSLSQRTTSLIDATKWKALENKYKDELKEKIIDEDGEEYYEMILLKVEFANPDLEESEIEALAQERYDKKIASEVEKRIEEYVFDMATTSEIYFKNQEQLNSYCAYLIGDIPEKYPSFIGVTLVDEPNYKMFQAIREVIIGLQSVDPDMYIMLNMLPLSTSSGIHTSYCENGKELGMVEAYKGYLENYWNYFGDLLDFFMYDDYPICKDGLLSTYLQCQQMVADFCKEHNLERRIAIQTYDVVTRRVPELADMLYQTNVALAFGVNDISTYTYLPTTNTNGTELPDENNFVVNRKGEPNPLYYYLQSAFEEVDYMSKFVSNFKYNGMAFYRTDATAPTGWSYASGLTNDDLTKLSSAEFTMLDDMGGMLLITEMYDKENDQWGYYVINGTDPGVSSEMSVTLTFNDYDNVQIAQSQTTLNVGLKEHKVTIELGSGRAAFVMPY